MKDLKCFRKIPISAIYGMKFSQEKKFQKASWAKEDLFGTNWLISIQEVIIRQGG